MNPTLDPVATGHKLSNIASNLRGQAALARENCHNDIFSCVLDGLADQVDEAVGFMFERRLKLVRVDSDQDHYDDVDQGRPFRDLEEYVATPGAHSITIMAKTLGIRPRRLVRELIDLGWIYRSTDHRLKVCEAVIANGMMQKNCHITAFGSAEIAKALKIDPNVMIRVSE